MMRLMMKERKMMRISVHQRNQTEEEISKIVNLLVLFLIDLTQLIDVITIIKIKMKLMTILILR